MAHYLFANSRRETDKPIRYFYVCDSEFTKFEKTFFPSFIYANFDRFKNRNIVFFGARSLQNRVKFALELRVLITANGGDLGDCFL